MKYIGVHDHLPHSETAQRWPGANASREFIGGVLSPQDLRGKFERVARPAWDAGLTPFVSFKPDVQSVLDGKWDTALGQLGKWLEYKPEAIVIPWHEPENNMSPTRFTWMFRQVRDVLKDEHPDVQVIYSAMAYQWRPGSDTTAVPKAWFPEADGYAVDVYSGRSFDLEAILPEHPGFKRWDESRRRYGADDAPWYVTERGFETSSQYQARAATIAREAEWLASSDCSGYLYWNTSGTENSAPLILDTGGEAAVRALVKRLSTGTTPPPQDDDDEYLRGYDSGFTDGVNEGYDDGHRDGLDEGDEAGYKRGYAEALEDIKKWAEGQQA